MLTTTAPQPSGDQMMVSFNNTEPIIDDATTNKRHQTHTSDDDDEARCSLNRTTAATAEGTPTVRSSATQQQPVKTTPKFTVDTNVEFYHRSPPLCDFGAPTNDSNNTATTTSTVVVVKYISPTAAQAAASTALVGFTPRALDAPLKFRSRANAGGDDPTDTASGLRSTTNHCVDGAASSTATGDELSLSMQQSQNHATVKTTPKGGRVSIAFAKSDHDACSHCYGTQIVSDAMLNMSAVVRRFSTELHSTTFDTAQQTNSTAKDNSTSVLSLLQAAPHDQLAALTATILQHAATVQHAIDNRLADPCTCGTVGMEEYAPGSPAATTAAFARYDCKTDDRPTSPPKGDNGSAGASPTQRGPPPPSSCIATNPHTGASLRSPQLSGIPLPPPLSRAAGATSASANAAVSSAPRHASLLPQTFVATAGTPGMRRSTRQRSAVVFHEEVPLDASARNGEFQSLRSTMPLQARKSLIVCTSVSRDLDDVSGFEMVNQYLMMEEVGSGTSGVVFAVCNTETNKDFAMKAIKRNRFQQQRSSIAGTINSGGPQIATNREVAIMKKLRHPNIVRLHEVIDDPTHNKLYLVMQLLTGGRLCPSLDMATGACEPVPADRLRRFVYQMCDGLRYLHQHNIIHRDVKPENMMLDADGNVVLVDFGVSEVAADEEGTVEGAIGTPAFMAPEVWDGDKVCGAAADVWSLGVSVFMMLVGRSPFPATTRKELIEQVRTQRPDFPPDMAPEWRTLLEGTLAKDPATRISLSAIMRNKMFAEFRPLDASTSQRPSPLRGAIVVTDDDINGAIANREEVDVEIMVGLPESADAGLDASASVGAETPQSDAGTPAAPSCSTDANAVNDAVASQPLCSTLEPHVIEGAAATRPHQHRRGSSILVLDEAKFHRALVRNISPLAGSSMEASLNGPMHS